MIYRAEIPTHYTSDHKSKAAAIRALTSAGKTTKGIGLVGQVTVIDGKDREIVYRLSLEERSDYLLRGIPDSLMAQLKHRAIDRNCTLRQYILDILTHAL
jgi:hypothetical protein